jgi:large subunit ribosomal protein L30
MPSESGSQAKKSTTAAKKGTTKNAAKQPAAKKTVKKKTAKKTVKKKTAKKSPAPRKAASSTTSDGSRKLRVRQVRSGIGYAARVRRTLTALGLKHHQDEVMVVDNPAIQGMLRRVHHLVRVTSEES